MRSDRALALLLLLPAAVLAVPSGIGPLSLDPYPHLSGAGWVALLALPAAVAAAVGGRVRPRGAVLLLLAPLALGVLARLADHTTDTLEADRTLLSWLVFAALVVAASGLGEAGRVTLARGLVALSLAFSAVALLRPFALGASDLGGVLGNTGFLSQAALPGAVVGALFLARRGGAWGALGLLAAALFTVHAALAPVLAGALAFVATLGVAAIRSAAPARARPVLVGLSGLAALAVGLALLPGRAEPGAGATGSPDGATGGVAVRALVWGRVPALVADHALLGAGPGQTAAAFPPYRDPAEIERSTHDRLAGADVEIDHVHNDWLQGFVDAGVLGGAAWALFLALAALAAARALGGDGPAGAELGAAGLALLVNGLAHEPLGVNPAAMVLGAGALGATLARKDTPATRDRALAWVLVAGLLVTLPTGLGLAAHGRALRGVIAARSAFEGWREATGAEPSAPEFGERFLSMRKAELRAIERALDARPDSVPALLLGAESERFFERDPSAYFARVLERRPDHVQALLGLGRAEALRGEVDTARALFERAHTLDPGHPAAGFDLASLLLAFGEPELGLALARELAARGRLSARDAERLASHQVLTGELARGLALLALARPEIPTSAPELMATLADRAREEGEVRIADALLCGAQWRWAREHIAAGRAHDAVRSYRQAELHLRRQNERGAPPLAAEHAAALVLDDDLERARAALSGLAAADLAAPEIPGWARQALTDAALP